jgi:hypothetical protein
VEFSWKDYKYNENNEESWQHGHDSVLVLSKCHSDTSLLSQSSLSVNVPYVALLWFHQ